MIRPLPPVALVVALTSCLPDASTPPARAAVDSAGVEIVSLRAPAEAADWSVSAEPELEIGVRSGEDPYLFDGIVGGTRIPNGGALVCNGGDRTLRRYGPDGAFLGQTGGRGGGPSELRLLGRCFRVGDAVWAYQAPFQPIKIFDVEGRFLRIVEMPRPDDRPASLVGVSADGTLLLRQDASRLDLPNGLGTLDATILLAREQPGGHVLDTLWVGPGGHWVREGSLVFPAAFSPSLRAVTVSDLVVLSWPAAFDLAVMTRAGRVLRHIRLSLDRLAVRDADVRAFRERILTGPMPAGDVPYQADEVRRAIVDMMEYPAHLPAHERILVDSSSRIWVERADAPRDPLPQVAEPFPGPTTWDVVSIEGAWLATVALPARFEPLEIGEDYVLGVQHDELGVERLVAHTLVPGN